VPNRTVWPDAGIRARISGVVAEVKSGQVVGAEALGRGISKKLAALAALDYGPHNS